MATFKKRGDKWNVQVRRKGFEAQTKTFHLKSDAERWARMVETGMDGGTFKTNKLALKYSLKDCLERYQDEVTPKKKSRYEEQSLIRQVMEWDVAKRPIGTITAADIALYRDGLLEDLAPATVVRRLSLISSVFTVARREWEMRSLENPVKDVTKPTFDNSRERRLMFAKVDVSGVPVRLDELGVILAQTESPELRTIFLLAVETGMRRSELHRLTWKDVDFESLQIFLPTSKNGKKRSVPLSQEAEDLLAALPRKHVQDRIFTATRDQISKGFAAARQAARAAYEDMPGVDKTARIYGVFLLDLHFHDLRHEAISRMGKQFSSVELAAVSGHTDPKMLQRYFHPDTAELAQRMRRPTM